MLKNVKSLLFSKKNLKRIFLVNSKMCKHHKGKRLSFKVIKIEGEIYL